MGPQGRRKKKLTKADVLLGQPGSCMSCGGGGDWECGPCGGCGCIQFGLLDSNKECVPIGYFESKGEVHEEYSDLPVIECSWVVSDVVVKSLDGVNAGISWGVVAPAAEYSMANWFVNKHLGPVILRQSEVSERLTRAEAKDIADAYDRQE